MGDTQVSQGAEGDRLRLGRRLREARLYLGLSLDAVAAHLGLPRLAVARLESGRRPVEGATLEALGHLYRRPLAVLLGEVAASTGGETATRALFRSARGLSDGDRRQVTQFADFLRYAGPALRSAEVAESPALSDRPSTRLTDARARATEAASGILAARQIDVEQRIDVAEVIARSPLWLMFQPFEHLYGGYVRVGDSAGIIVNAAHPPSTQRFTAAHEYGHYLLGHEMQLDDARIERAPGRSFTEVAAHTFAAALLLPPPLVAAALRRQNLPPQPDALTPRQVYRLALDCEVSYSAAVTRLTDLGAITAAAAADLWRVEPRRIKAEIGGGVRPRVARADVWPLDDGDAGHLIYPRVHDELHLRLPERPSSGYRWTVVEPTLIDARSGHAAFDASRVALIDERFEGAEGQGPGGRLGGCGTRHLALRLLRPGRYRLRLVEGRPWDPDAVAATWELTLVVAPRVRRHERSGLSEQQKALLLEAA